ncbi:MAG: right-handed parallel beta-helix repeat-containing protein, partial [Planctomycetes bacterium]|nr:right-handed parallel beta-helix repeat-containing protein [Planctomycetota bacterium]
MEILRGEIAGQGFCPSTVLREFDDLKDNLVANIPRLTIAPGNTISCASGVEFTIGNQNPGELYAEGLPGSQITFTPQNGISGGWGNSWAGLQFFHDSDASGATSSLRYCVVEKASGSSVFCAGTNQPTIAHTTLTDATSNGLHCENSSPIVRNIHAEGNANYGVYLIGSSQPVIGDSLTYTCNL